MTDYATRADLPILGESSIYPGHPVVMALIILRLYDGRLADAFGHGRQYATVEEDGRIPGAGGHASDGVRLIRWARDGVMSVEEAVRYADALWASCDGQANGGYGTMDPVLTRARWQAGQEQADRFKMRLVEELRKVST